ncbi:MAG: hydroxymethylglutaryl-CoA lyase [Bacteroidetes bacterium]|nr:hydroxymethylglutaryl-CoA lyase [Bacteroidota bacterium]
MQQVKLIECPRDAMQGLHDFIPTEKKTAYINALLKVGFDTIDFGSFVSPKAIPQLSDTKEVLSKLQLSGSVSKLLAIIANVRGAEEAAAFDEITYLGFPFSVSEEFQKRNANSTISESLVRIEDIQKICVLKNKQLVVYISMGFGNPYGEPWNADIVIKWVNRLSQLGVRIMALSDTVGVSTPENIQHLFSHLIPECRGIEFGAHLHSNPLTWEEKITAAYDSGCRRFDSAMKGIGGCPMATDQLTGNMATENLVGFFEKRNVSLQLNRVAFSEAMAEANEIFG